MFAPPRQTPETGALHHDELHESCCEIIDFAILDGCSNHQLGSYRRTVRRREGEDREKLTITRFDLEAAAPAVVDGDDVPEMRPPAPTGSF
ncbi:hypothetical protein ACWDOP_10055 [Nocardia sp. NPDC003693]